MTAPRVERYRIDNLVELPAFAYSAVTDKDTRLALAVLAAVDGAPCEQLAYHVLDVGHALAVLLSTKRRAVRAVVATPDAMRTFARMAPHLTALGWFAGSNSRRIQGALWR